MIATHTETGLRYRKETNDHRIIGEVKSYLRTVEIGADDVVMDVGGHIGIFAKLCADRGAGVVSYEPMPENAELFVENSGTELVQAAVASAEGELDFYVSRTSDQSNHTLVPVRGREKITVRTVDFATELARVNPTVVKIDIEGGEYELFERFGTEFPERVRMLLVEFHFGKRDFGERAERIWAGLNDRFDEVVVTPKVKAWNTFGIWRNN